MTQETKQDRCGLSIETAEFHFNKQKHFGPENTSCRTITLRCNEPCGLASDGITLTFGQRVGESQEVVRQSIITAFNNPTTVEYGKINSTIARVCPKLQR